MKLIIMRHGEAEAFKVEDKDRQLTQFGISQSSKAGIWLAEYLTSGAVIDLAIVSPYIRAEQTYQQVSQQVKINKKQISNDVTPSASPQVAHDLIAVIKQDNPEIDSILLVSHMPFVSYFLEEVHVDKQSMLFATASIAVVEYNESSSTGILESFYHPS